jgi:hypothetical protein
LLFYRLAGDSSLRRFRSTYKYERRLVRSVGPKLAGWPATLRSNAVSCGKEGLGVAIAVAGLNQLLLARKVEKLSMAEEAAIASELAAILSCAVPGW